MCTLLVALTMLVAAVTVYQGLVLRGLLEGAAEPLDAEAATFVLVAGGAMVLAAVTLRWSAGSAAIELALAGVAVVSVADPDHRYLLGHGAAALVLAVLAGAVALMPAPVDTVLSAAVERGGPVAPWRSRPTPPVPRSARGTTRVPTRSLLPRIARVRARHAAGWQAWRIAPRSQQTGEAPAVERTDRR